MEEPAPLYVAANFSTSVLCKSNANTALCGESYGTGTSLELSQTGTSVLETTGGTTLVTCSGATLKAGVENAGGASSSVAGSVSSLGWSGCTNTVNTLKVGSFEIRHTAGTDNGIFVLKDTEVTVNGIFGSSCNYGYGSAAGTEGALTGGSPATVQFEAVVPRISGGFTCPADTVWKAEFEVEEPAPLYVAAA